MDVGPFEEQDLIHHQAAIQEIAEKYRDGTEMSPDMQAEVEEHLVGNVCVSYV